MQDIFTIEADGKPLMPCSRATARRLLDSGRATIWRRYPFTIMRTEGIERQTQGLRLKIDPGSRVTGLALVREDDARVVWAAELEHRGAAIKSRLSDRRGMRRGRRTRNLRHRAPRFENRTRPDGWLAPSLLHRPLTTMTWVRRLRAIAPITALSYENVAFDTQLMENPDIGGEEYQHGTLWGYDVKEYLLEAFDRTCVYCGKRDVKLEVEHIIPRSRGGSSRVSNLAIACVECNRTKGNQTAEEFGHPEVQKRVNASLRDMAAVNATRWRLWRELEATGLPLECGSGGRTKWNRTNLGLPKEHWIDAACVGETGASISIPEGLYPLVITAVGHGSRQLCITDAFGFPIRHRARQRPEYGINTGDIVLVRKPLGTKDGGRHIGRVTGARQKPSLDVRTHDRKLNTHAKYCEVMQRADGYGYRQGADPPQSARTKAKPKSGGIPFAIL